MTTPLLNVDSLTKEFVVEQSLFGKPLQTLRAVDDVNLELYPGETLGIVGESGCGKTTLGRLILRLLDPTSGRIHFKGHDITDLSRSEVREFRQYLQVVFQERPPPGGIIPNAISLHLFRRNGDFIGRRKTT